MNPIDDMFRDGLDGRKGEIPADMWKRVSEGKPSFLPEGEGVDQYFSDALKDRAGDVPSDMWSRIAATGVPAAASLDQVFADGLRDRKGEVPAGMWDRIWKVRTAAPLFSTGRVFSAVAAILLLLGIGWWVFSGAYGEKPAATENLVAVAADRSSENTFNDDAGSAVRGSATTTKAEEARGDKTTLSESSSSDNPEISFSGKTVRKAQLIPTGNITLATTARSESEAEVGENISATGTGLADVDKSDINDNSNSILAESDGAGLNDLTRPVSIALSTLTTKQAISALETKPLEVKMKKGYRPKTPPVYSFRNTNRHRLQTEFLFGAFYANQQFSAETDDQRAQRNIREITENPGLSYQVSLRGAYKLNDRLVLRSGLTYSEIRNRFDYERLVNGTPTLLRTNNLIRQVEVPVLMGLHIPGRRLNVSLNAGPLVNLTTSVQGRFLDPDSIDPLSLAADGQYRSNVGVGFMTSLSTTYVIGKKQPFVLLVEPFFKAYPGSFTQKEAPLRETYWAAGLQLGIRKGF